MLVDVGTSIKRQRVKGSNRGSAGFNILILALSSAVLPVEVVSSLIREERKRIGGLSESFVDTYLK